MVGLTNRVGPATGAPVLDEQGSVGMPEIVKSDGGRAGVVHDPPKGLVHLRAVDGFAVAVGEHPLLVAG